MTTKINLSERSYEKITKSDLKKLLGFAHMDRKEFFSRNPRWGKLYANRVICVALCQGAALHYLDGENGVKDFDVWTFYSVHPEAPFPYRRIGHRDYGISKFGCHPLDTKKFKGRCVDLIGRSFKVPRNKDPIKALKTYLRNPATKSAKELSKKAVVLLYPEKLLSRVIWPERL